MALKDGKLISLQQIEGAISPHQKQIDMAIKARKEALEYVTDVSKLAEFIGGRVESLGIGEDWAVSKEIFPGVFVFFVFNHADDEFKSNLKVLFSGDRIKMMRGEDLAGFVILYLIHMLRYVRDSNTDKKLPEVCYRV
jgi:predicted homoserine dehydrogenase-like protein